MKRYIVQLVETIDFTDKATGERIQMVKIHCPVKSSEKGKNGCTDMVITTKDMSVAAKFSVVPGIYSMETEVVPSGRGKVRIEFIDAKFEKEFKLDIA